MCLNYAQKLILFNRFITLIRRSSSYPYLPFFRGKRGFGSKRVILFSDVGGEFGDDNLNDIVASMKEAEIELNVMYVARDISL